MFSTFSENTITKAIGECEPGKPLAYLSRILERMRAETVPQLRREELFAQRINLSTPLSLPEFRSPGFIEQTLMEELFFRAIQ